jgi:hypothetical protein
MMQAVVRMGLQSKAAAVPPSLHLRALQQVALHELASYQTQWFDNPRLPFGASVPESFALPHQWQRALLVAPGWEIRPRGLVIG